MERSVGTNVPFESTFLSFSALSYSFELNAIET